jgi:hypothetical protein
MLARTRPGNHGGRALYDYFPPLVAKSMPERLAGAARHKVPVNARSLLRDVPERGWIKTKNRNEVEREGTLRRRGAALTAN